MKKVNKRIQEVKKLDEAVVLVKDNAKAKFTESVDLDIVLNLKESQKKESVRGSITLPNQFGEEKKVIVFGDEKTAKAAEKAGAVKAGLEDLMEAVEKGTVEYDIVIATPNVMAQIAKLGKVLGPRGLMPNPKNGTVATDVEAAVQSFKSGKLNFKMDGEQGAIRSVVAKVDMAPEKIIENVTAFIQGVYPEVKKFGTNPIKKIVVKSTMGPSVKLEFGDIITK